MKLIDYWALKGMPFKARMDGTWDVIARSLVSLLPRRVRYWATMREVAHVTCLPELSNQEVPAISLEDIIKNLRGAPK